MPSLRRPVLPTLTVLLAALALPAVALARSASITASEAIESVKYLLSPELEGRGALTRGLVRAGDYIADRFKAAGFRGGADDGTFFQAVDIRMAGSFGPRTHLATADGAIAFDLRKDWNPNPGSAASSGVGEVVFAGYGITLGSGKYDDYAGIDVRGKVVLLLRYAPGYDTAKRAPADPVFTDGASIGAKADNAAKHGAIGLAIVDGPAQGADRVDPIGGGRDPIASFHLSRGAADKLLAESTTSIEALQKKIDGAGKPASFALPRGVAIRFEVQPKPVESRNVVAILDGADPALRDEAILIGAHYDHLGLGDEGSALDQKPGLHPGADDNASGTSALLEIADALGALAERPRRSIVLVTFTGEEKGLIGSAWNASHLPPKKIVAMINMDMVGRMKGDDLEVGGAPTGKGWQPMIEAANEEKLKLSFPPKVVRNSDHYSYLKGNIPALFLFTGLHSDYHRATDTWDKVNAEGIARAARLAYRVALATADRQERLTFVTPQYVAMGGGRPGVRLGILPDYQVQGGAGVGDVSPGGAAAAAGIHKGDVIKSIGGKPVTDMDSYMNVMAGLKYGADVVIEVERAGSKLALPVKLTPPAEDPPANAPPHGESPTKP